MVAGGEGTTEVVVSFTEPGAVEWTVPAGICAVTVEAWGASGGRGERPPLGPDLTALAGLGARVVAPLAVTPGALTGVVVGGRGRAPFRDVPGAGGFGGGGNGGITATFDVIRPEGGGGGGGFSGILAGASPLVVAGGGGGVGAFGGPGDPDQAFGGDGGLTGSAGGPGSPRGLTAGGGGGTDTVGGAAGADVAGDVTATPGLALQGGDGGGGSGVPQLKGEGLWVAGGGGGGGGYFGGGGGGAATDSYGTGGGGGGGSSFGPAGTVFETGFNEGDGAVVITYDPADQPADCGPDATTSTTSTTSVPLEAPIPTSTSTAMASVDASATSPAVRSAAARSAAVTPRFTG
ncbi:MAG: hypothetical protein MUE36_06695 [Acidimicrobiales bacterium]|jgi:hypothetical protein|nr:hypothetical protein [Acidimicrobiales bacterium]